MIDREYAFNHWRKTFEAMSGGCFTKKQFDDWFENSANLTRGLTTIQDVEKIYKRGSKEHFYICLLWSFENLIGASSDGIFGRRDR